MKILLIGDIVARPGRLAIKKILPEMRRELAIDLVVANVENLAHGRGVTRRTYEEMIAAGVDIMTGGNHTWAKDEINEIFKDKDCKIIRPANFPDDISGCGWKTFDVSKKKVVVINLIGRVFMHQSVNCPFRTLDSILKSVENPDVILVDFHADATSEKNALAWYADKRVTALYGTHTHVPTADANIFPGGMAYITDIGMTGLFDSVLGVKKESIIKKFLTQLPTHHEYEESGLTLFRSVLLEIDDSTGKALSIERRDKKIMV